MEVILFLKFNIILCLSQSTVTRCWKVMLVWKFVNWLGKTCEAFEIKILKGVVSHDHVHILVSAPPNLAPSEIMRRIKGRSSMKLFESFPDLKKRYWGRHFWARGYFCVTSGELTDEMIKNYLEHHFESIGDDNFRTETWTGLMTRIRTLVHYTNPPALAGGCLVSDTGFKLTEIASYRLSEK